MLIYNSRFLTQGEVWFDNQPDDAPVDWIFYRQRSSPVPKSKWKYFYTRLVRLSKSPDSLFSEMDPRTAQKITESAETDKIVSECCDLTDPAVLGTFEAMYNEFAAAKKAPPMHRARLDQMVNAGLLDISLARSPAAGPLLYHATYRDHLRAQQLLAVSRLELRSDPAMRHVINRANCLLVWNDLLRMKKAGLRYFDFGGWYTGATDIEKLGMNTFKKGFGGEIIREYCCEQILTLKGRIVLAVAKLLRRARLLPPASYPTPMRPMTGSPLEVRDISPAL